MWTGLLLLPLAFLLDWLGLISLDSGLHRPQRFVNAPYYPGGIWAVVADLAAGALVVVVAGLAIHGQVLRRTGYEIPRWILIGTLALTGWLPYLGLHLLPMSTFVAFLATVLVARLSARPTRAERPERWPWPLIGGLFAVALFACLSYAAHHPLRVDSYGSADLNFSASGARKPAVALQLNNGGFADLTVLGVDADVQLAGPSMLPTHPFRPTRIRARRSLWLFLPASVCRRDAVQVRYRVLGGVHTQPLLLPSSCAR